MKVITVWISFLKFQIIIIELKTKNNVHTVRQKKVYITIDNKIYKHRIKINNHFILCNGSSKDINNINLSSQNSNASALTPISANILNSNTQINDIITQNNSIFQEISSFNVNHQRSKKKSFRDWSIHQIGPLFQQLEQHISNNNETNLIQQTIRQILMSTPSVSLFYVVPWCSPTM